MTAELVSDPSALAWEARACWATGRRVSLVLGEGASVPRLAGVITAVAPTGAFLRVRPDEETDDVHVPMGVVLSLSRPHFHESGVWRPRSASADRPDQTVMDGQLGLVPGLAVSERSAPAMARAARSMLPPDVLAVLAGVDHAGRRPTLGDVSEAVGRSERWVSRRLRVLERERYVRRVRRARRRDVFLVI